MLFSKEFDGETWSVEPFNPVSHSRDDLDWAVQRCEVDEGEESIDTFAFLTTETSAEALRDSLSLTDLESLWQVVGRDEGSWDDMDWVVVRRNEDGDEVLAITQTEYLAEKFIADRTQ